MFKLKTKLAREEAARVEAEEKRREEEEKRRKEEEIRLANGMVTMKYTSYTEQFELKDGR